MTYKLYSFDIFDTIVTRNTATPKGIFFIIHEKLKKSDYNLPSFIKENFYYLRVGTEIFLREMTKEEITIYDIYNNIAHNNFLTDSQKELLINIEFETEIENSVPIEENINKIKELLNNNKQTILISDMYLPSKIIRKILESHNDIFKNIPIYVSNEYKARKENGELYKIIKDKLGIEYNEWIHTGDNIIADIREAKKLSITTKYFNADTLSNFNQNIIRLYGNNINIERFIGYIKCVNIRNKSYNNIALNIGISIGGPLLFFYVNWVIETSIKNNIKNIYFMSRDGFILKNIADIIIQYKNIKNIETHYLYASRYAWQLSAIYSGMPIPEYIFLEINIIKDLEHFFQIDINTISKFLPKKYRNPYMKVTKEISEIIKNSLVNNNEFYNLIKNQMEGMYLNLLSYLKQNINFNEKFCIVDLRGSGTTAYYMSNIIKNELKDKLEIFFLNTWTISNNDYINKRCFCNGYFILLDKLELLVRAMHEEVLGYEYNSDKVVPIFNHSNNEVQKLRLLNYDKYIEGVEIFVKNYLKVMDSMNYIDIIKLFIVYSNCISTTDETIINNFFNQIPNKTLNNIVKKKNKSIFNKLFTNFNFITLFNIKIFSIEKTDKFIIIFILGMKISIKTQN